MKIVYTILAIIILILVGFFYTKSKDNIIYYPQPLITKSTKDDKKQFSVIAEKLDTPWSIVFLPDKNILVSERMGRISLIKKDNLERIEIAKLDNIKEIGEGGLLGMTLHPNFSFNKYIYFYYTYESDNNKTLNRVVRMIYDNKRLGQEQVIVDKIPGASNHNGGRIKFGPDNFLYITTGDAQDPSQAQDTNSLAGKILRVTDDGKMVINNPFNNLVYSYGHRNSQGLAWDNTGRLWSTEHGRSGVLSGLDELNIVKIGKNYGWPKIQGDETQDGMEKPVIHSKDDTWAPAGVAIFGNSIFFGGLRGKVLYEAVIKGDSVSLKEHFKNKFGRIREVVIGQDGFIYITTSNLDGRGNPLTNDDKIIKIDSTLL